MRPTPIDRAPSTYGLKFLSYLQRRPGRRDRAPQSFELRIKSKEIIIHTTMSLAYVVERQPYASEVADSSLAAGVPFCFL